MSRLRNAEMFAALTNRNYRLYLTGQAVSLVGTWMQAVALGWLVFTLTGSGVALGLVTAVQFVPMLLLGPYGGLLADRLDKRRLLVATQAAMAGVALILAVVTLTGIVAVWMLVALALVQGLLVVADTPARQAFVSEMVGRDRIRNAVSLNSVLTNAARALGPALAAVLIAGVGTGVCFLINALTFAGTIAALLAMDRARLRPTPPAPRAAGQVREGMAYVGRTTELLVPLMMLALVGTLAYEFSVVLPLLATGPLGGGVGAYGLLTSAMGAGAIVGGLMVAARGRTGLRPLSGAAAVFGLAILLVAVSPTLPVAVAAMVVVGGTSVLFLSTGNATLQLRAAPPMRGRVMALWAMAFVGSTPIGAPIIGLISQQVSPRGGLMVGALACLIAAAIGYNAARRLDRRRPRKTSDHGHPTPATRGPVGGPQNEPAPRPVAGVATARRPAAPVPRPAYSQ